MKDFLIKSSLKSGKFSIKDFMEGIKPVVAEKTTDTQKLTYPKKYLFTSLIFFS